MSVPVETVEGGRQACAFGSVQESLQTVRNASTRSHMHVQAGRESVDIFAKVGVAFPRRTIGSVSHAPERAHCLNVHTRVQDTAKALSTF